MSAAQKVFDGDRWSEPLITADDWALFGRPVSEVIDDLKSTLFAPNNIAGVIAGGTAKLIITKPGEDRLAQLLRVIASDTYGRGAGTIQGD